MTGTRTAGYRSGTKTIKHRIARYWNGRAASFQAQREAELCGRPHQLWAEELISHLGGRRGLRILDVGCGCGFFSFLLAEDGHDVTGIDLSENMIARGRELARKYGTDVTLRQMDAENPAFADGTFDVIVSRNLTWTLPHPARAYAQWMRVLKPGGLLLNYDAEHAKYHLSHGLEGERAHAMLSQGQREECMDLYGLLPLSGWARPEWDVACLEQLGCAHVTVARVPENRQPDNAAPYPIFRIKAFKPSADTGRLRHAE